MEQNHPIDTTQKPILSESSALLADLAIARETNRRLNRRCQKLERRINKWQSSQYTINRWRTWLCVWYRAEKARADRLEFENQKLRRPSMWARLWKSANKNYPDNISG